MDQSYGESVEEEEYDHSTYLPCIQAMNCDTEFT